MDVKRIDGTLAVDPDAERPRILFLLEGPGAPLAFPVMERVELSEACAILFEGVLAEAVVPDGMSVQIVRETFFEFEVSDAHRHAAVNYLIQRLEECEPPPTGGLAKRAMEYLCNHLSDSVSLDGVGAEFGCSKSGLLAAFKRAGLLSPMKELARLRIEKACDLLKENELNVSQVARAVGYGDLAAFNHFFRRHMGRSPSDYRENCNWIS